MLTETKTDLEKVDEQICQTQRLILELTEESEKLFRGYRLNYFVPNPGGQEEFFSHADKYLRAVFSGNRFGKSTAGVVEDCCWLLGYRPFYSEGHPLRYAGIPSSGVKGLVVAATWEKVRDIFTREGDPTIDDRVGKFFHYLPPGSVTNKKTNQHSVICQLEITSYVKGRKRVSVLVFDTVRSFLSNPLDKESSDWDFIHIDEPIPQDFWTAISRGLIDRQGKSWWLMTPKTEPWMYHEATNLEEDDPTQVWTYTGDTDENLTLTESAKEQYFKTLSDEDLACRKSGRPVALSRLVVSNFSPQKHILKGTPRGWSNPFTPPKENMVAIAVDTHPQTPHAVLKVCVSPHEEIFIYGERFKKGSIKGKDSVAEWILSSSDYKQVEYLLLEPGAWIEDQTTGRRFVDDFYDAGLSPEKGSKKRTENIILFNELFGNPARKVYVLEHCRVFINEIQRWYFDKDDKPKDENDHMMENFGRLLAHDNLKYHSPTENVVVHNEQLFSGLGESSYNESLNLQAI